VATTQERIHTIEAAYRRDTDEDRPLRSYAGLLAAYGGVVLTLALAGRRRLPGRLPAADLALGAVATFEAARVLTKDPVTSPLRAPFTRYEGVQGPAELSEEVRGTGWRHALGELLTCPFCISQWLATAIVAGLVAAPRLTRTMLSVLGMVAVADFLQFAYSEAEQAAEG